MALTVLFLMTLLKFISATRQDFFNSKHAYINIMTGKHNAKFCIQFCLAESHCISASFNQKTLSCELSSYHPADIASKLTNGDGWTLFYRTNGMKDNWTVIFRGTSQIGIDVAKSFVGTNSLPFPEPKCYSWENIDCNTHVRSSWIDNWNALNIKKVKVEMLTSGQVVAFIIFRNRATDNKTKWFSPENILNSSWTDLPSSTAKYSRFKLERIPDWKAGRSFNVHFELSQCPIDKGWMFVSEESGNKYCSYEQHTAFPLFMYTTGSTAQVWETAYGIADVMLISIKT